MDVGCDFIFDFYKIGSSKKQIFKVNSKLVEVNFERLQNKLLIIGVCR